MTLDVGGSAYRVLLRSIPDDLQEGAGVQETVIEFLITTDTVMALVFVKWLCPLGRPKVGAYDALETALEELNGAEHVTVGRYSATIRVARHVATEAEVAQAAFEALTTDEEFAAAIRFEFLNAKIDVTNAGETVRV